MCALCCRLLHRNRVKDHVSLPLEKVFLAPEESSSFFVLFYSVIQLQSSTRKVCGSKTRRLYLEKSGVFRYISNIYWFFIKYFTEMHSVRVIYFLYISNFWKCGQPLAEPALSPGKEPSCTHLVGDWVNPRGGVDVSFALNCTIL